MELVVPYRRALTTETSTDSSSISNPDVDNSIQDNEPTDTHFDVSADNFIIIVQRHRHLCVMSLKPKSGWKRQGSFTNRFTLTKMRRNQLIVFLHQRRCRIPRSRFRKGTATLVSSDKSSSTLAC